MITRFDYRLVVRLVFNVIYMCFNILLYVFFYIFSADQTKHSSKKNGFHKHKENPQAKQVDKLEELEKLRNSEKMMDEFLASTAPQNKETNKNERTKTIIKTIRVCQYKSP